MRRIYVDHTATTPLDERVLDAMRPYFVDVFGNASSVHGFGREAKVALERARETIAASIGAQAGELFFTSGGTEADNFAIRGAAIAGRKKGKNHMITSAAEHHAVLEPCRRLSEEGFDVTIVPVDSFGSIAPEEVSNSLTDKTCLVSVIYANNEVGTISPITEIAARVHERGIPVHTDAVQALGKIPVDVRALNVDLMSVSAHKLYGPKGIGALYVKRGSEIEPILYGGGQERGKRPGTENVPLAVGFAKAVELAVQEMEHEAQRLLRLRDRLALLIRQAFPAAIINGHPAHHLPHILNVSFDSTKMNLDGEALVMSMDLEGVAVTSGSACTSGSMQPSHVLLAMGRDQKTAKATLRFAFGKCNVEDDVPELFARLKAVIDRMTRAA
ncbi:MAG: cysteine desulfurase NifS [Ignavibacteria bacterium]